MNGQREKKEGRKNVRFDRKILRAKKKKDLFRSYMLGRKRDLRGTKQTVVAKKKLFSALGGKTPEKGKRRQAATIPKGRKRGKGRGKAGHELSGERKKERRCSFSPPRKEAKGGATGGKKEFPPRI